MTCSPSISRHLARRAAAAAAAAAAATAAAAVAAVAAAGPLGRAWKRRCPGPRLLARGRLRRWRRRHRVRGGGVRGRWRARRQRRARARQRDVTRAGGRGRRRHPASQEGDTICSHNISLVAGAKQRRVSSPQRTDAIAHGVINVRRWRGQRHAQLETEGRVDGWATALDDLGGREPAKIFVCFPQVFCGGQGEGVRHAGERAVGKRRRRGRHSLGEELRPWPSRKGNKWSHRGGISSAFVRLVLLFVIQPQARSTRRALVQHTGRHRTNHEIG